MNSIISKRLSVAAVALCVAVPLVTASPPASGTPASAAAKKQKQGPPDHGDGGLPDQDSRYGKAGAPSVLKVADHGAADEGEQGLAGRRRARLPQGQQGRVRADSARGRPAPPDDGRQRPGRDLPALPAGERRP